MNESEEWITPREAGLLIGVSPRTVTRWIHERKFGLKFRKVGYRKWLIEKESLKTTYQETQSTKI